jgi:flagellar basal body-associated protein FliL
MKTRALAWQIPAFAAGLLLSPSQAAFAASVIDPGPTDVDLPAFFAPLVVENRLESYAYMSLSLTPASRDKVFVIREKMPFLRDAILREVNKGTITKSDDPKAVDTAGLKARLLARVNQILPANTVSDLKFEQIIVNALQPQS